MGKKGIRVEEHKVVRGELITIIRKSNGEVETVIDSKGTWTQQSLKDLILRSDIAVKKALKRIYSFQTLEEQHCKDTRSLNGLGFGKFDAEVLSQLVAKMNMNNDYLERHELQLARFKVKKYTKQLLGYVAGDI